MATDTLLINLNRFPHCFLFLFKTSVKGRKGCIIVVMNTIFTLLSHQFPFKVNQPLVTLEVEKEWTKFSDATAKLTMAHGFQRSSWDWVGLYKVIH